MPTNAELVALAERHLYGNYRPTPIVLAKGRGSSVFDVEGKRYLDLCAGVAVCSVGHAHPAYVRAVSEQVATVSHVSNYFYNEPQIRLAARLTALSGLDRVFFCNSGAEANEALFKLARRRSFARGDKSRTKFIAFDNAFHGRTMGALALTGTPKYREGFGVPDGVVHVPYGDLAAVEAAIGPEVAAVIVECVQGEGGVLPAPPGFLRDLRALCTKSGALLFVDEVQTGIGRLGAWFGFQRAGIVPDAISLAKGLGGGFPIGAILTTEALEGVLAPGTHGSTFGANPLGATAALAVLDILENEKLVPAAETKGALLGKLLDETAKEFPSVCEGARGEGLLRGLVLRPGLLARDVLGKLVEAGVLLTAAGERVLRFCPPLVVTEAELEEGVRAVRVVLAELAKSKENPKAGAAELSP